MSLHLLFLAAGLWIYEPAFPSRSSLEGSLIRYQSEERIHGAEVFFLHTDSGDRLMVHLLWAPLPDQEEVLIHLAFSDHPKKTVSGRLLKGGQKILLSEEATKEISESLCQGEKILFKIGPYKLELTPEKFQEEWRLFKGQS